MKKEQGLRRHSSQQFRISKSHKLPLDFFAKGENAQRSANNVVLESSEATPHFGEEKDVKTRR
jgi:hypothetical protein